MGVKVLSNGLIKKEKILPLINNIKTKTNTSGSITFDEAISLINNFSNNTSYPIQYTWWNTTTSLLSKYYSSFNITASNNIFKSGKPFLGWFRCHNGSNASISVFYFDGSSYTFLIQGNISSITTPSAGKITIKYKNSATLKQNNTDSTAGKPYFIVFYTKDW